MATLNEALTLEFKGDASKYMATLKRMKSETKTATSSIAKGFLGVAKTIAKIGVAGTAAFTGFAAVAVTKAAKAEKSFANLAGLFKESTKELSEYKEKIDELAWTMGVSTVKTTEAYYQAVSAGFRSVEKATEVVEAGIRAAIAGATEMPVAVEAITRVMNAYGPEMTNAADVSSLLFQTVNYGVTTFDKLAPSIGRVAGVSAKAGLSMEEMFASIASLTKLATTDESMTQLTAVITAFLKPTQEAQEMARKYKIELSSATLASGKFAATMAALNNVPQDALAKMFPNIRALKGVMTLASQGAKDLYSGLAVMNEEFDATANAYKKQEDTFSRLWEHFTASLGKLAETLGEVFMEPMKRLLAMWKTEIVPQLQEWAKDVKVAVIKYWDEFDKEMAGKSAKEKLLKMWEDLWGWFKAKALPSIGDAGYALGAKLGSAIIDGMKAAVGKMATSGWDWVTDWDAWINFFESMRLGGSKFGGHVPNYAGGNADPGELGGLIAAYRREKKHGPPGSTPVIANDSEYIIPTRAGGHVPNMAGGSGMFDEMKTQTSLMMKSLMLSSQTVDAIHRMGDDFKKAISDLIRDQNKIKTISRSEMLWGFKKPTFAEGGAVDAVVHRGEYVVNDKATSLFMPLLEAINRIGQGQTYHDAGTVNMNFGDKWSDRLMMDKVIPALQDAKRRGLLSQGAW
jgi:TP901 family phage tail tape measure protein